MDKQLGFLETEGKFWDDIAKTWSLQNKNPVVGWYDFHNSWEDYDKVLFDGIETKDAVALEYGCGPGRNIIKFMTPEWGFKRIDGVDISETNIRNAYLNFNDSAHPYLFEQEEPILIINNGSSIAGKSLVKGGSSGYTIDATAGDNLYDIVFSVICMQHIQSHDVRCNIMGEINRVLKPGGVFTAQMGFGGGHPRSVDYFHNGETHFDGDVRVENVEDLKKDLLDAGFSSFRHVLRPPCKDEHPQWIWFQCLK